MKSGYNVAIGCGPIFLDQVNCSGSEQSLLDSSSEHPIGLHHCNHTTDVGFKCQFLLSNLLKSCIRNFFSGLITSITFTC